MFPLIMAHRGGNCFGPENSLQAIRQSLLHQPDIIEVDVRKSKDDLLFCYHGNIIQYLASRFFLRKNFAKLQRHYPSLVTLPEIAQEVGEKSILFLDIKDYSISLSEITTALQSTNVKQVYLAAQNLSYLKSLGLLPPHWKKVCNGVLWLSPKKKEISSSGLHALELFFWDYQPRNIKWLEEQQIAPALARWLLPQKRYIEKCLSHSSLWMWDDRLVDLIKQRNERS